jgi:hypothetical protein
MTFDASGSRIRLDGMTLTEPDGSETVDWWAELRLEEARLVWTEPLALESRLALGMRDTGLLARLFVAGARERDWLARLLTVPDVEGTARVRLRDESIHLWNARLSAGPLVLFADLKMEDSLLNGELSAVIQPVIDKEHWSENERIQKRFRKNQHHCVGPAASGTIENIQAGTETPPTTNRLRANPS